MIVLQIEVTNFTLPDVEGRPPIAADRNASRSGATTVKLMNPPAGRPLQGLHVRRRNQRREYPPQALHEVAAQIAAVIVSNEAQQAAVADTPNDHSNIDHSNHICTARPYRRQVARVSAASSRVDSGSVGDRSWWRALGARRHFDRMPRHRASVGNGGSWGICGRDFWPR